MIDAVGKLRFGNTNVVVDIDQAVCNYYFALIPKYYCASPQMWRAHITVVRTGIETWPRCMNFLDGSEIAFSYENTVRYVPPYFFIRVYSDQIGRIRQSMGMTFYSRRFDCFHITVANTKAN